MAPSPKPKAPLRILTIDGGGLSGSTTLMILDDLLKTIARESQIPENELRPCDVFDVITGTGTGGWLALLLGRFQMSVSDARADWFNLMLCIKPETGWLRMAFRQHSLYDTDRLVEQIDWLTGSAYKTGKCMFLPPSEYTRCKHVFVSAVRTDSKQNHLEYNLFRTYDCPKGLDIFATPEKPVDPQKYQISHAFAATGATKYFISPWKAPSAGKGESVYQDVQFSFPHNITRIALRWSSCMAQVQRFLSWSVSDPGSPVNPTASISWEGPSPSSKQANGLLI